MFSGESFGIIQILLTPAYKSRLYYRLWGTSLFPAGILVASGRPRCQG
jgi:hypothetical protein